VIFNNEVEKEKKYTFETLLINFIDPEEKTSFSECFKNQLGGVGNK